MNFLAQVQISCFFFSYLVSFGLEIYRMARQRTAVSRWLLLAFTSAGLLARHFAYLLTRSRQLGINPLMSSGQDWLLVLAWIGVVLYLILSAAHDRLGHGLFMLPAVLMLVAVAVFSR